MTLTQIEELSQGQSFQLTSESTIDDAISLLARIDAAEEIVSEVEGRFEEAVKAHEAVYRRQFADLIEAGDVKKFCEQFWGDV